MRQIKCDNCKAINNEGGDGFSARKWLRLTREIDTYTYNFPQERTMLDFCGFHCLKQYVDKQLSRV